MAKLLTIGCYNSTLNNIDKICNVHDILMFCEKSNSIYHAYCLFIEFYILVKLSKDLGWGLVHLRRIFCMHCHFVSLNPSFNIKTVIIIWKHILIRNIFVKLKILIPFYHKTVINIKDI